MYGARVGWIVPLGFALCFGGEARAQSVTIAQSAFEISRDPERSSGEAPFTISREDCLRDDEDLGSRRTLIQVTPKLTGFNNNMSLEVWVGTSGTDCSQQMNRQSTTGRCNLVFQKTAVISGETFTIHPRDVVLAVKSQNGQDIQDKGTEADCDHQEQVGISFYFMLVQGGNIQGTTATWSKSPIDTRAPDPPSELVVESGDGLLFPEWKVPTSSEASDTQGFRFYCEEVGASPGSSANGGAGGAGGASASADCSGAPSALREGLRGDQLESYECGDSSGRTTRSGKVEPNSPLKNGVEYAVAVAAYDQVGNVGELSPVVCGTPAEVTTFFEAYRESGGKGGGGFCQMLAPKAGSTVLPILASLLLPAFFSRRRRRPVRRASSP